MKTGTYFPSAGAIERGWWVANAEDQVLGRLATAVAAVLRGKNKPTFTPFLDTGDFVVVVNADKIRLTGRKTEKKIYYRYSGYPGGMKSATAAERMEKDPTGLVRDAIVGMLPHNRLGRQLARKLKIYAGPDHPHGAQQPRPLAVTGGPATPARADSTGETS
ncbi:MAG: 50S ribosomal protein L13 [Acidobacteriota bacterium]